MDACSFGTPPAYAELQVASDFSFLHGASRAEEYVARAAQLGYSAIAITDECSLAGVVRAHVEAKAASLPLIIGSHFRLKATDGSPALAFTALAMNRDGYGNLCELVSLGRMRGKKGTYRLAPLDLEHPEAPFTHLRGLPDCIAILSPDFPANEQRLDAQVEWIVRVFGDRAWVTLTRCMRARWTTSNGTRTTSRRSAS
ncbi:PHP domain protein [Burkholderia pseudomallei MSHR5596]|uniref:PHP domain protein n=1 Tax=Burkholderia pseudomallei TaxID=28450 RepID=A0AA40JIW0_BURPE|nr:PHP domain protein [Burkholderia pseudomallei MSHR5596]KGX17019.1 PHP domain protein [Burkholderia pseudomallei]